MTADRYVALDLGAESGRAVVGAFDGRRVTLEEVHRFPNGPVDLSGTLFWDAPRLFTECVQGIAAANATGAVCGAGIDTWGVDFGLVDHRGWLVGLPRHYRDHANDGAVEAFFQSNERRDVYATTGIQCLQFNTLFQLDTLRRMGSAAAQHSAALLMMPDLLGYWLTGNQSSEYTIASTSQLLDARTRTWDPALAARVGLDRSCLPSIVEPGGTKGTLLPSVAVASQSPPGLNVYAPAEHDTGSAVAAVPAEGAGWAYLSSGTWSLLGVELPGPVLTDAAADANFTNEGGVFGTIRFLKNIMGLWLVQETRRSLERAGSAYSYPELVEMAAGAPPFTALIDPDAPAFLNPVDMPDAVRGWCRDRGLTPPETPGSLIRTCLESLALKYRHTLEALEALTATQIHTVHIVGGGCRNALLCQFAADSTGRRIVAGPVEATALGNVLMQAVGAGRLSTLADLRRVARDSVEIHEYLPARDRSTWDEAYGRFTALL